MQRPTLAELAERPFDLLILGGGIIGCGAARDAARRGLRVGLVERDDFGSGTTSRSTRLIHGGLRYLELLDFALVREDLREREILLRLAPHLIRPLPFLVPMYGLSPYRRARLKAGLLLYDALSFDGSLPRHRFLSKKEMLAAETNLQPAGLQGAVRYVDGQVEFPERLCLENALDAAANGALLRNYTQAERFLIENGRVRGVEARDTRTGELARLHARQTLNITGPWLDRTLNSLRRSSPPLLRTTKGIHLVTQRLSNHAVVLFARSDGRLFFVVPWNGMSLVGTTDSDEAGAPETVRARRDEVRYLLEETRRAFPGIAELTPYYAMAGVRALVRKEGVQASEVSRKHKIYDHATRGGPAGLLSVLGGKITGYRAIAEEAVDRVCRRLSCRAACTTRRVPLPGAPPDSVALEEELEHRGTRIGLDRNQRRHLAAHYGSRVGAVLDLAESCPELAARASPEQPTIMAEIVHAVRDEAAVTLADVLLRRTSLGFAPSQSVDTAPRVAKTLGQELGWDSAGQAAQVEEYRSLIASLYRLGDGP